MARNSGAECRLLLTDSYLPVPVPPVPVPLPGRSETCDGDGPPYASHVLLEKGP